MKSKLHVMWNSWDVFLSCKKKKEFIFSRWGPAHLIVQPLSYSGPEHGGPVCAQDFRIFALTWQFIWGLCDLKWVIRTQRLAPRSPGICWCKGSVCRATLTSAPSGRWNQTIGPVKCLMTVITATARPWPPPLHATQVLLFTKCQFAIKCHWTQCNDSLHLYVEVTVFVPAM